MAEGDTDLHPPGTARRPEAARGAGPRASRRLGMGFLKGLRSGLPDKRQEPAERAS